MSNGVLRALVTGEEHDVIRLWQKTAYFANWLETRQRNGRNTSMVTVFAEQRDQFVSSALETGGVTVEEVVRGGEDEEYSLLVGVPGTGWVAG